MVSRASAAGDSSAAPAPWSTRAATSASGDHARAQPADAAENSPRPIKKVFRRPATSATRPPQINSPPNTSVYAVKTHCRSASLNSSPSRMAGKAMTTIVTSSITMNWVMQTIAIASGGPVPCAYCYQQSSHAGNIPMAFQVMQLVK